MKQTITYTMLAALLAGTPVLAADMGGMKMDGPSEKSIDQITHGKGLVKSINLAKGTVTLKHEPIPSLKWPAMTMPFKITWELASSVKPGQQVEFEFTATGMNATITKIMAVK